VGWTWRLPSLDGQQECASGGHLENPPETAGQRGGQDALGGLDGQKATPQDIGHPDGELPSLDEARRRYEGGQRNLFILGRGLREDGFRRPDGGPWTAAALGDALGVRWR
jgi:hypothetical protein